MYTPQSCLIVYLSFKEKMKKNCELCKGAARVYCESDQASLCWSCDAKVHSANFLVARHVRSLLCHSCHSPTAWSGSGHKLGRTLSICEPCVKARASQSHGANEEDSESGIEYYDTDEDVNEQDELLQGNPEDGDDNQVVPLSSCSSDSHPYRLEIDINISPEGSDDYVADLKAKDDLESSSPRQKDTVAAGSCSSVGDEDSNIDSLSLRPFKFRKLEANRVVGVAENSSSCSRIGETLRRINHGIDRKILGGGAEAHECFDLDLNECP